MKYHYQNIGKVLTSLSLIITGITFNHLATPVMADQITAMNTNVMEQRMTELRQAQQRWIEINLTTQRLIAWEGNRSVYGILVSTGRDETPTFPGVFTIQQKRPVDRMVGEDYDVPDVPFVMYYHSGYAIHGAYWHHNFGTQMSHGCTNVAVDHAEWLFNWASIGTPVVIHY